MGVLTYKGAVAKEALGTELLGNVPGWVKKERLPQNAIPGAKLFATSGCLNCHTYLGIGSSNLGAPDLSAEGAKHKGLAFQIAHLRCPSCVNKGSPMPSFAGFGTANLQKLALFIEASKGPQ
jgi:mono/diheme cytochrome c family protein